MIRFGNLNFRSVIGALLYVSCCTRPDISYAVNKLAKYANNPGATHFRALLHLIVLKANSNKGLKFYNKVTKLELYKVLQENNIEIKQDTNVVFTDSSWNDCVDTLPCHKQAQLTMVHTCQSLLQCQVVL